MENNEEQNINIAVINNELKHINKILLEMKAGNSRDHQEIFNTMARKSDLVSISDTEKEVRVDIDSHCIRIRELEKRQAVETYKLAAIVSGVVFLVYFAVNAVWNYLIKKI